jgi:hypothetical protein
MNPFAPWGRPPTQRRSNRPGRTRTSAAQTDRPPAATAEPEEPRPGPPGPRPGPQEPRPGPERSRPTLRSAPEVLLGPWTTGRCGWPAEERGGATLIGLALTGYVLLAGVAAVDIGALAVARAAAQTAADMAALAALTPRAGPVVGDSAVARAAELAGANGAELVACDCSAVRAVVGVRRRQRLLPAGLTVTLTASARAVLSQPPSAKRATVRAVDLSRAADGNLAERPGGPAGGGAAGRPVGERECRDGGGAVRSLGRGGPGRRPRCAAHQPRGPPDRAGRTAAGGPPPDRRPGPAAGRMERLRLFALLELVLFALFPLTFNIGLRYTEASRGRSCWPPCPSGARCWDGSQPSGSCCASSPASGCRWWASPWPLSSRDARSMPMP